MPEFPHPELEVTLPVLIAEAAHRRLAADPPLQAVCEGRFVEADLEDLALLEGVQGPTMFTLIDALDEDRSESSNQGKLRTLVTNLFVVQVDPEVDVRRHLRTRVAERVKRVYLQPTSFDRGGVGVLQDLEGRPLTDHLERFQRVPLPRWISSSQLLTTTIQSLWITTIDLVTREIT